MEMRTLTKQVLNELIDHIDVYETQGTGKNKTQRLVIYYKFVGYLDIDPTQCHPNYTADIREGVAVKEAQTMREPLFDYAPRSNPTKDYEALLTELEV